MEKKEDKNKMNFDAVKEVFAADNIGESTCFKEVKFDPLSQPSGSAQIPCDFAVSVSDFIKDLKEADGTPESKKKGCGIVWFISVALFILLAAVYAPLFYGWVFKPTYKPIEISVQPTLSKNDSCNCCRCMSSSSEIKLDVDFSLKRDSACYDVVEVTASPNGTSSISYRRFDKWAYALAIILTVSIFTALVFFILFKRKSISADHERERLELENQNKLVNKYIETRLAEQQLNIHYNEEQLSLARQKQLYKMDMHQKEQDNWWKHIASLTEAKKTVLLAMIEAEKEIKKGEKD